jgi:hypothetical protein
MTIAWFIKDAGSGVLKGKDNPEHILVDKGAPEWVRLPANLGGSPARIVEVEITACPAHHKHDCRHYVIEGGDIGVAECDKFYWYRRRKQPPRPAEAR